MSEKKESDHGSVKITDSYLTNLAQHQIKTFIDDLTNCSVAQRIRSYANAGDKDDGRGAQPGVYTRLMPGGDSMASARNLKDAFKGLCVNLEKELKELDRQMGGLSTELQSAQTTLNNAQDEALTAAQMIQILNGVYNDISTPAPQPQT